MKNQMLWFTIIFILGQSLHVAHKQVIRLSPNMRSVQGALKQVHQNKRHHGMCKQT